jgi:hypothetical protein
VTVTGPAATVPALVGVVSLDSRAALLVKAGASGAYPDETGVTAPLTRAADAAS